MLTWHLFKHFVFSNRAGALVRTIAWLCSGSIGIGVFALIVVISVMNGFNQTIRHRLLAVEPHLVVEFDDSKISEQVKRWSEIQAKFLAKHPSISLYQIEEQDVILRTVDGYFGGAKARGVDAVSLEKILDDIAKNNSQNFSESEPVPVDLGPGEILMGIDLARKLGIFEGDQITLAPPESLLLPIGEVPEYERVTVKGFISSQISDIDSQTLFYITGKSLLRFREPASRKIGIEIRMEQPLEFAPLVAEIEAMGFTVESWKDRNSAMFRALQLERTAIGLILTLSGLIASFSIATVLILLLTHKKKEIGILMALGLSPKRTYRVFTQLGMMISGFGMAAGIIFGTLVSLYIEKYPLDILPDIYYDSHVPALVDFSFILTVAVISSIVACIAAWYPAKQVSKLLPINALRP